ncbi:MTH1187 family thiamine-binding protein [Promicromonospora sp. Populi]|uniref:thiamine-binding protein n=1 Tax=Promicromonospora sp. Populi TaxID=3239420 RepID=UPI0034E27186
MLAEIQVSPRPSGTPDAKYAYVDAAIAVIQASGLTYEVGAMGTFVQGSPDEVWALLRAVHEATLGAGADGVQSNIKVSEAAADAGPTIADLITKFRA